VPLLLFDIDGTLLIRAADDHRDAILAALRRVWHVHDTTPAHVETAGRTDPWIARAILLQLGVSADRIDDGMPDFRHLAVEEYRRRCRADLSAHVAPGVTDALEQLRGRPDVTLSLVTGNLERIAHHKLARAGIGAYFARGQGGYGSDDEDRAALPQIARERAGRRGQPHPREDTIVIGDTPLDIACARADGVRVIGVTTGQYGRDDLADADEVVSSARELLSVL
jgi:phosphoglycolate phosphatase-like HAD superfamily hydrolase